MFYVLLVVNVIYVMAEFLFNFILLNTASTQVSLNDIHSVEIVGRSLAAFGFTFIFWKLIEGRKFTTSKKIVLIALISTITYPLFYFGQEKLVNSLAENSSIETREKLHDLFLLKQGLIGGGLQLESIPYSETIKDLPESKTFITNISLFMVGNDAVLNYIKKSREEIATHVFKTEVINNPKKYIAFYDDPFFKVHMQYLDYDVFYQNRDIYMKRAANKVNPVFEKMQKDLYWYYKRDKEGKRSGISYEAYVNKSKIKDQVREEVKKKHGVILGNDFNPASLNSMRNAFAMTVYREYAKKVKENEIKTGMSVPEGLSMDEFKKHPAVIAQLKKSMGSFYVNGLYPNWIDRDEAEKEILVKNNAVEIGNAFAKEFLNQDMKSQEVTSIVKAMIVPPIALILSLSFAFINLFILIKSYTNKVMVGRVKNAKLYSTIFVCILISALFILPAALSNKYTESSAYQKVYDKMNGFNIVMAVSVDWIMKLEPFVYNFGSQFVDVKENKK